MGSWAFAVGRCERSDAKLYMLGDRIILALLAAPYNGAFASLSSYPNAVVAEIMAVIEAIQIAWDKEWELQPQKCSSHHPKISDMLEDQYTKIIGKQCGAAARIQAPGWRQQRSSSASELSESALPLPVINAQI
ncbi:hypothetical protein EV1_036580 [Malus domestica]